MQPWDAKKDGLALAGLALAALVMQGLVYDRWIGLLDEGAILQIADQINHGAVLYRDATHLAWPGVFYLTAGLFELFGTNILVTRWLMVFAFTLLVCLIYLLARGVAPRSVAVLIGLVAVSYRVWVMPHWLMISYSSLASLMTITATALLAQNVRVPDRRLLLAAGGAIGLAITFKQDSGGLGFVLLGAFLLFDSWVRHRTDAAAPRMMASVLPFAVGAVAIPAFIAAALTFMGAGPDMFHQTVAVPLLQGKLWAPELADAAGPYLSFPPMWPPFSRSEILRGDAFFNYFPSLVLDLYWGEIFRSDWFQKTALADVVLRIVYSLPYALILGLSARELWLARAKGAAPTPLVHRQTRLLLCLAIGMLVAFNRPRDWIHLLVLYPGTILLLAPALDAVAGAGKSVHRKAIMATAALAVAIAVVASFTLAIQARSLYDTPISGARAGVRVEPDTARVIDAIVTRLETPEGHVAAPLGALPYYPMLNFLTGRPLATRFITLLPMQKYPDRDEQALASFASDPRTDLIYGLQHMTGMPKPQDYAPTLFAGLVDRYSLGEVFDSEPTGMVFALLEPRAGHDAEVVYRFADHLAVADSEEASSEVSLTAWAFERPVISFAAAPAPKDNRLRFALPVGALGRKGADLRLRFAVAMNPDEWRHFLPTGLHFRVRIDDDVVFDRFVDPRRNLDDRRWIHADIPLANSADTIVSFELSTDNGYGTGADLGGFADPRIVAVPRR